MATRRPLVSVCMAVFNDRPFLARAITSIVDQTSSDWELLISDDGSMDGSRELLRSLCGDPRIRLTLQPMRLGLVANKNFLRGQARGRFVTQQDADDTSNPHRLERQLAVFQRDSQVGIVGCGMTRVDAEDVEVGRTVPAADFLLAPGERPDFPFWFAPMMVRSELIEAIGDFHPYFDGVLGEDHYWGMRALEKSAVYCLAEPLYAYRISPQSMTNFLDGSRKLTMPRILELLVRQRQETGTDLLEQGDLIGLAALERSIAADRSYMAEQFRIWGAKAIDRGEFATALGLLASSLLRRCGMRTLRTTLYLFRALGAAILKRLKFVSR